MGTSMSIGALPIGQIQIRDPEATSETTPLAEANPTVKDGCQYSPTCFDCPLPRCRHDYTDSHPPKPKSMRRAFQVRNENLDVNDIRKRWRLSERSAYRLHKLARSLRPTAAELPG